MAPRNRQRSTLPFALLLSLWSATTSLAAISDLPRIDFSALGSVAVVGSFAGLELYDPASPPSSYDSTASTLLARSSDGALSRVGATNTGGRIEAICQSPAGNVFVGGSFTSFGGVPAANIAAYTPSTRAFTSLGAGLDGAVLALSCNGTTVYAGGSFTAPVGSAAGYGGRVAAWSTASNSWSPLAFSGLNGAVESISSSEDGRSLFFGGSFTTTFLNSTNTSTSLTQTSTTTNISLVGNGTVYASLGSSLTPISLNTSDFVASPTTYTSGFGRPQYIFCPKAADGPGSSWLMVDGTSGSYIARSYRPMKVRGIRLGNTFWEGRGTRNFSLTTIPDNTVRQLSYSSVPTDPSSAIATCQANCILAHDESVPYQDFVFDESVTITGFELNIFGFYGAGAGLHLLQLLSEGAYDYAVEANNISPCTQGLGASVQSSVDTKGNWTETSVVSSIAGTEQSVLYGYVAGGTAASNAPTLTWNPTLTMSGQYTITFYTPACEQQSDCSQRTSVSVAVTPAGGTTTTTTINQNTGAANLETTIYTGPLVASSQSNGGVTVTVSLASGAAARSGTMYHMIADHINLIAASTNGNTSVTTNSTTTTNSTSTSTTFATGRGLFEYALVDTGAFGDAVASSSSLSALGTLQNATAINELSFGFASGANVTSVVSVGSGATARVFVGGSFTYSAGGVSSANVVSYSGTSASVAVAPNGGLNGAVVSLAELDGFLYAAGRFTATLDGAVTGLAGAARWSYATAGSRWEALGGTAPTVAGSIAALGTARTGTNSSIFAVGGGGSGLAMFTPASSSWNSTAAGYFAGNLTAFGGAPSLASSNATAYFAGNVLAASTNLAPGGALLMASNNVPRLSSFGFSLDTGAAPASSSTVGAPSMPAFKRSSIRLAARSAVRDVFGMVVSRQLAPSAPATALPANTTLPSALSADGTAEVLAGAYWTNGSTQFAVLGGRFTTSTGVTNVGLYNVMSTSIVALPGETVTGTVSSIAVIHDQAWIAGDFTGAAAQQGLSVYNLNNRTVSELVPTLGGYTGETASATVVVQRPGFESEIIVAGAFSTAGAVACQSVCSWDARALQWSAFGQGLAGTVGAVDFAGGNSEFLIAAGSFVLNGTTSYVAQWSYRTNSWTILADASALPGPATAITVDGTNENKVFVAGASSGNAPYLMYWNGTAWTDVSEGALQAGSGVQQLVFVPLSRDHPGNSLIESDRMLMVSGDLTINSTSVSSALFDGDTWHPYLVSTSASGPGVMTQFFYSYTNFTLSGKHLSVGIVILISIAIALGVVFLLVLIGLLIALARRRDDPTSTYPPRGAAEKDDRHRLNRPTALLTTVGAATAVMLEGKNHEKDGPPRSPVDHDSVAGPMSYEGSYDDEHGFEESVARARYSFQAEHVGELSVSTGEDLVILEASDENWYLVANSSGQRGLFPRAFLA